MYIIKKIVNLRKGIYGVPGRIQAGPLDNRADCTAAVAVRTAVAVVQRGG